MLKNRCYMFHIASCRQKLGLGVGTHWSFQASLKECYTNQPLTSGHRQRFISAPPPQQRCFRSSSFKHLTPSDLFVWALKRLWQPLSLLKVEGKFQQNIRRKVLKPTVSELSSRLQSNYMFIISEVNHTEPSGTYFWLGVHLIAAFIYWWIHKDFHMLLIQIQAARLPLW